MYQSGFGVGIGFLVSAGMVETAPALGSLWWFARLILDVAGLLFGCYLVLCLVMTLAALAVRGATAACRVSEPHGYL